MDNEVVAVTKSYRNPRGANLVRFHALLPPDAFASPPNNLELYFVQDAEAKTLTPLIDKSF